MIRTSQNFKPLRLSFIFFILFSQRITAQDKSYKDSLLAFQANYVDKHEVVGKDDKKYIQFYDVDESYRVKANFERINDDKGFNMGTSTGLKRKHYKYGLLTFKIKDSLVHLFVYQQKDLMKVEKYKDYLFVPFGDATSGFESYGGGRYLDLRFSDVKDNSVILDFNKAYNPYCAYTEGYDCPVPPKENLLTVAIPAGEKNYAKKIH